MLISKPAPTVSKYVLVPCVELTPPSDGKFSTIVGELVETVGEYKTCSNKNKALIGTVNSLQKYIQTK